MRWGVFFSGFIFLMLCWSSIQTTCCAAETCEPPSFLRQGDGYGFLVQDGEGSYLVAVMDLDGSQEGNHSRDRSRPLSLCQKDSSEQEEAEEKLGDIPEGEMEVGFIPDPFEPINRVFFHFNDKLYFWVLKPVATGYKKVTPDQFRICVRNFFSNLFMPIRAVNCLLQGKFQGFGIELLRFLVNSTAGMLGLMDPAQTALKLDKQDEDFGQTLGLYGLGPGFFINWPILGPSSVRGTVGFVGDMYLDPAAWVSIDFGEWFVIRGYEMVNTTSLSLGEYEALKKAALDPYVALRDAYYQYRQNKIKH
jgi:phospholipid-binding lipoprotein MlaA